MQSIRSSDDLQNNYNEISCFCHTYSESVFITKNGKVDLAVMSIEAYERLIGRVELYNHITEGLEEINSGSTRLYSDAIAEIRSSRKKK